MLFTEFRDNLHESYQQRVKKEFASLILLLNSEVAKKNINVAQKLDDSIKLVLSDTGNNNIGDYRANLAIIGGSIVEFNMRPNFYQNIKSKLNLPVVNNGHYKTLQFPASVLNGKKLKDIIK